MLTNTKCKATQTWIIISNKIHLEKQAQNNHGRNKNQILFKQLFADHDAALLVDDFRQIKALNQMQKLKKRQNKIEMN